MAKFRLVSRDQRQKAPRFLYELEVTLTRGGDREACRTSSVGLYHIAVQDVRTSPVGQLVSVQVPQGREEPIAWMGLVTEVTGGDGANRGLGLELYAIEEPEFGRWSWVVGRIAEKAEAVPAVETETRAVATVEPLRRERRATAVEVRVQTLPALVELAARQVSQRSIVVRRVPGVAEGDPVELVLHHPVSGERFRLQGTAERVDDRTTALSLEELDSVTRKQLEAFILGKR